MKRNFPFIPLINHLTRDAGSWIMHHPAIEVLVVIMANNFRYLSCDQGHLACSMVIFTGTCIIHHRV